jgi:cysteine desulfuration protein SufE
MNSRAVAAARPSIVAAQQEIVAELAGLEDMLQKYEYLVRQGVAHQAPDDSLRHERHAVQGCQARVWIRAELRDGLLHLEADSDAMITRGLVALLLRVLDGRTPAEILGTELFFLDRTGLGSHLSPARGNGMAAMVRQVRRHAEEAAARTQE